MPKVVAVTPALVHGDTEVKPRPAPAVSSIRDTAALTTAPPKMALQETAEDERAVAASTTPRWVGSAFMALVL